MEVTREDLELVERVASRFMRAGFGNVERDDLVSDGTLALPRAVDDWDRRPELSNIFTRDQFLVGRVRRGRVSERKSQLIDAKNATVIGSRPLMNAFDESDFQWRLLALGEVFRPSAPVGDMDLFADRRGLIT